MYIWKLTARDGCPLNHVYVAAKMRAMCDDDDLPNESPPGIEMSLRAAV